MITTTREDLARLARSLRDHGASKSDLERHEGPGSYLLSEYHHLGFNFRLTDIQGALGVVQMDRLEDILVARRAVAARYDALLGDIDALRTPAAPADSVHAYQAYVTLFAPEPPTLVNLPALHARRNGVMAALEEQGIATRPGTHAAALQAFYVEKYGFRAQAFPNAWIAEQLTIALPLYPQLPVDDQDRVVDALERAIDG
jgi:dTDP-4-amino-4,6-dideoxygalactose transaminase